MPSGPAEPPARSSSVDATPLYRELGLSLRQRRRAAGLSLRTLARRLGMSAHSGLVDYERGVRLVPADLLDRYVEVFADRSGELHRLRRAALAARAGLLDRSVDGTTGATADQAGVTPSAEPYRSDVPRPVPARQIPADLPDFVGRRSELEILLQVPDDGAATPAIVLLHGTPGIGKSSLAVHAAHRLADRYPDGYLYLDLRGPDDAPPTPVALLRQLLRAVGAGAAHLPPDTAELAALYRSVLHGRRVLLLLDDAASEGQVRPLLPGTPGSLVLITSRGPLSGLDGVRRRELDALSVPEAVRLLGQVIGTDRVAAEPVAAEQIVRRCAGMPLAIRIAAARLATWSSWRLADCAAGLAEEHRRLTWLAAGDRAVHGAFDLSYRALPEAAARLLRRVALLPAPQCDAATAAALAETDVFDADQLLSTLMSVGLAGPAEAAGRYRFHDLTLLYARERLHAEEDASIRHRVEVRLLTWLLGTALQACGWLDLSGLASGDGDPDGPTGPAGGSGPEREPYRAGPLHSAADGIAWLDAEQPALPAAMRRAATLDLTHLVYPLPDRMAWYHDLRCRWDDQWAMSASALELARRRGDEPAEVPALNGLALAALQLRQPEQARRYAAEAVQVARRTGDLGGETWGLDRLGMALTDLGRRPDAVVALDRAASLAHEYGDWWEEGAVLNHLGHAMLNADDPAPATDVYRRALLIFVELRQPRSEAMARVGLGRGLSRLGQLDQATEQHRQALALFRAAADDWGQAHACHELAVTRSAGGDDVEAVALFHRAAELFAASGDRHRQADTRAELDRLCRES